MSMNLPIYELRISEEENSPYEVTYVALVDSPAIKRDFEYFNNKVAFEVQSEEKRILSGPIMLAELPIYRRNEELGEYYVVFKADTIQMIAQKFFKKGYQSKVNEMHDMDKTSEGIFMFESYLIDRSKGKNPPTGFEDVADGSWFGSYKVENDAIWAKVKDGTFKGFSVEGSFDIEPLQETKEEQKEKAFAVELSEILKHLN